MRVFRVDEAGSLGRATAQFPCCGGAGHHLSSCYLLDWDEYDALLGDLRKTCQYAKGGVTQPWHDRRIFK